MSEIDHSFWWPGQSLEAGMGLGGLGESEVPMGLIKKKIFFFFFFGNRRKSVK